MRINESFLYPNTPHLCTTLRSVVEPRFALQEREPHVRWCKRGDSVATRYSYTKITLYSRPSK